jgi:hypothetical protein
MAKRKRRRARVTDVNAIAAVMRSPVLRPLRVTIDDYRTYHPEGAFRPPLRVYGQPARWREQPTKQRSRIGKVKLAPGHMVFTQPKTVMVCVRRKTRRNVLFAKGFNGRKHLRKGRLNANSRIKCK